jgi:hypothetical protein
MSRRPTVVEQLVEEPPAEFSIDDLQALADIPDRTRAAVAHMVALMRKQERERLRADLMYWLSIQD